MPSVTHSRISLGILITTDIVCESVYEYIADDRAKSLVCCLLHEISFLQILLELA